MDRTWYIRLSVIVVAVVASLVVLWPTLHTLTQGRHEVRRGETLAQIAARYGTTEAELAQLNELERGQELRPGQELRTPGWLPLPDFIREHVDRRITPGLDIQGGLRMMYTVDMDTAVSDRRNARAQQMLRRLGEKMDIVEEGEVPNDEELARIRARVTARSPIDDPRVFVLEFRRPADLDLVDRDLVRSFGDLVEEGRTENTITFGIDQQGIDDLRDLAVEQAQETIKNRIAEMGITESNVRAQDIDIIVEVPGGSEEQFDRIRELISQTAHLEFKIVDETSTFPATLRDLPEGIRLSGNNLLAEGNGPCPEGVEPDAPEGRCTAHTRLDHYVRQVRQSGRVPEGRVFAIGRVDDASASRRQGAQRPESWRTYVLYDQPPNGSDPVGGEHLEDARVTTDPQRGDRTVVGFQMNAEGARRMQELTGANLNKQMAIVLDGEVESAPTINGRIGAQGIITLGGYRDAATLLEEARDLVIVLRAGALPAPIIPQNEQYIGPTLGRDSVQAGTQGALIGILLVLGFMGVYYSVAGIVADVMVLLNVLFLFGIMAFFNNDLTLPGIAGIALTVGMAVDANVLINERMREEVRAGKSPRAVVDQGFRRAFSSIFDGQITTFIAAVVMLQYGSPEIQGFARTLMIGIVTSLFTGVFCSKVAFDWLVRGLRVSRLRVG